MLKSKSLVNPKLNFLLLCRQDQKGTGGTGIYSVKVGGVMVRRCAVRGILLMCGIGSGGFSLR